jgi:hypothetical protein
VVDDSPDGGFLETVKRAFCGLKSKTQRLTADVLGRDEEGGGDRGATWKHALRPRRVS